MFDDPNKELQQLQEQLLKEEEWFQRELDSAKVMLGDTPAKKRPAAPKTAQPAPKPQPKAAPQKAPAPKAQPKPQPKEEPAPKEKSNRGLVILAVFQTLGIVAVAAYWVLYLL